MVLLVIDKAAISLIYFYAVDGLGEVFFIENDILVLFGLCWLYLGRFLWAYLYDFGHGHIRNLGFFLLLLESVLLLAIFGGKFGLNIIDEN